MRRPAVKQATLVLAFGLLACNGGDGGMVESPAPVPAFTADRLTAGPGEVVLDGEGLEDHVVTLTVLQQVTHRPSWVDLLLRVDPAAEAELVSGGVRSMCGGPIGSVVPTGNAGEWRIKNIAQTDYCPACTTSSTGYLGTVNFRLPHPGSWRVTLAPDAGTSEICGCGEGCSSGHPMFGGTVTNPY